MRHECFFEDSIYCNAESVGKTVQSFSKLSLLKFSEKYSKAIIDLLDFVNLKI